MGRYNRPGLGRSLNQAWRGILYTWKTQRHFRFHLLAAIAAITLAWWVKVSRFEWLILVLAIGSVMGAELMNTALEVVVDMVQPNFHPLAGMAKDVASGAVLMTVIQAIVVGMIVFFPRMVRLACRIF